MGKRCVTCGEVKDETEYNWRYSALGIRHKICRECQKGHHNRWYQNHKEEHIEKVKQRNHEYRQISREYVWNYLSTHPCVVCGESDPVVLEFDHIYGKDKDVSRMVAEVYSIEAIQREIEKCQVLCANCHRKKTAKERGWDRR